MTIERHRVPIAGGALALALHLPERPGSACVVACHGLGASKDSDADWPSPAGWSSSAPVITV